MNDQRVSEKSATCATTILWLDFKICSTHLLFCIAVWLKVTADKLELLFYLRFMQCSEWFIFSDDDILGYFRRNFQRKNDSAQTRPMFEIITDTELTPPTRRKSIYCVVSNNATNLKTILINELSVLSFMWRFTLTLTDKIILQQQQRQQKIHVILVHSRSVSTYLVTDSSATNAKQRYFQISDCR